MSALLIVEIKFHSNGSCRELKNTHKTKMEKKSERKTEDDLEKDCRERTRQGRLDELEYGRLRAFPRASERKSPRKKSAPRENWEREAPLAPSFREAPISFRPRDGLS